VPPLVSIVVPCYLATGSQAALLDETLGTVAQQTCSDYEVIVVDDGSPVAAAPVARSHPRAVALRQENAGPAMARNAGIARSQGAYLVFLDADDHLLAPALEAGLEALKSDTAAGFAVGPREEMTFDGKPVPWAVGPPPEETDIYRALLAFEWYIIPPSTAMFRRDVVTAIGGFQDPWGADDLDFYLRAAFRYPARCYQSPAVTRYRRYSTSASRDGERMLHSVRAVYERQRPCVEGNAELEAAFRAGLRQLTEIFVACLVENIADHLRAGDRQRAMRSARLLARESPVRWHQLRASDATVAALVI
jgi:glycosyltransferase involved in cell wall biosynthesis